MLALGQSYKGRVGQDMQNGLFGKVGPFKPHPRSFVGLRACQRESKAFFLYQAVAHSRGVWEEV